MKDDLQTSIQNFVRSVNIKDYHRRRLSRSKSFKYIKEDPEYIQDKTISKSIKFIIQKNKTSKI